MDCRPTQLFIQAQLMLHDLPKTHNFSVQLRVPLMLHKTLKAFKTTTQRIFDLFYVELSLYHTILQNDFRISLCKFELSSCLHERPQPAKDLITSVCSSSSIHTTQSFKGPHNVIVHIRAQHIMRPFRRPYSTQCVIRAQLMLYVPFKGLKTLVHFHFQSLRSLVIRHR